MSDAKLETSLHNLSRALDRLQEALNERADNPLLVDGVIQRFEFGIELYWKTLRRALSHEGIETKTPKESLQKAFQARWIDNEMLWLNMLKDRNATSHLYDQTTAREIFERVRVYMPELRRCYEFLRKRFPSEP